MPQTPEAPPAEPSPPPSPPPDAPATPPPQPASPGEPSPPYTPPESPAAPATPPPSPPSPPPPDAPPSSPSPPYPPPIPAMPTATPPNGGAYAVVAAACAHLTMCESGETLLTAAMAGVHPMSDSPNATYDKAMGVTIITPDMCAETTELTVVPFRMAPSERLTAVTFWSLWTTVRAVVIMSDGTTAPPVLVADAIVQHANDWSFEVKLNENVVAYEAGYLTVAVYSVDSSTAPGGLLATFYNFAPTPPDGGVLTGAATCMQAGAAFTPCMPAMYLQYAELPAPPPPYPPPPMHPAPPSPFPPLPSPSTPAHPAPPSPFPAPPPPPPPPPPAPSPPPTSVFGGETNTPPYPGVPPPAVAKSPPPPAVGGRSTVATPPPPYPIVADVSRQESASYVLNLVCAYGTSATTFRNQADCFDVTATGAVERFRKGVSGLVNSTTSTMFTAVTNVSQTNTATGILTGVVSANITYYCLCIPVAVGGGSCWTQGRDSELLQDRLANNHPLVMSWFSGYIGSMAVWSASSLRAPPPPPPPPKKDPFYKTLTGMLVIGASTLGLLGVVLAVGLCACGRRRPPKEREEEPGGQEGGEDEAAPLVGGQQSDDQQQFMVIPGGGFTRRRDAWGKRVLVV